mgnify:CR=1 FL=1
MRKAVLYIAMSLDGYIADRNGGVGCLSGHGTNKIPVPMTRSRKVWTP